MWDPPCRTDSHRQAGVCGSGQPLVVKKMLSAICLPQLSENGHAEIQAWRFSHDPVHANLICPHVTLIFPTDALPESDFIGHVGLIARAFSRRTVCFRSALPYREPRSELSFLYLVPDEGFGWLNRLHERLYSGPLGSALDPIRPYIPHITIGRLKTFQEAHALSECVNSKENRFCGLVSSIEIVRAESSGVRRIHSEQLYDD